MTIRMSGRQQASTLAAKIQRDIDYGEFDASLVKYKPAASLSTVTPIATTSPEATTQYDLEELWEKYTEFKKPQISPSTYAVDYRKYRNHIASLKTKKLDDAILLSESLRERNPRLLNCESQPEYRQTYFNKHKCLL
jgi:integrase